MGFYDLLAHGTQYEKFFQRWGFRKASSSILQVTLAGWTALFSVIIVLIARITHNANAVTVFLGSL